MKEESQENPEQAAGFAGGGPQELPGIQFEENFFVKKKPPFIESFKIDLYFWLQAMTMSLITLIMIFTLLGRVIGVDGKSMLPTLHDKDMILLQSLGYTPHQGDIVVLSKPFRNIDGPIVKRVIAVGGQTVSIDYDASTVSVDGEVLDEPYLYQDWLERPSYENITSITVPEGSIFVMGDNRNASSDSRDAELGVIDIRYVLGGAKAVLLPIQDFRIIRSHSMGESPHLSRSGG